VNLGGRTVLVTGATGGLGGAIARALAGRGASLILSGRRADVLEALASELRARAVECDLAVREDVERLATAAADADVLVANAGVPASGRVERLSARDIDVALDVNLRAPIQITRALLPAMLERGSGHLLYVASLSGKVASPRGSLYSATKFGLRGFAAGLREDVEPRGIGVPVVYPGFISEAGMFADSGARLPPWVGTKTPRQVADAVVGAIERERAEVDVAPFVLRAGSLVASLAPVTAGRVQRRLGSAGIADAMVEGQRPKR
jgi:uncharacterized protein